MKIVVGCVAISGWYPRGVARLINEFHHVSFGYEIQAWINTLPPGAHTLIEGGKDYTGYAAKPFALQAAMEAGANIAILMDAAFYPIRNIGPLVEHINKTGYYLCKNGFSIGQWANDRTLDHFGLSRDEAMQMDEASSYCVGMNFNLERTRTMIQHWCDLVDLFPGPHTNTGATGEPSQLAREAGARNPGFCSADPRCHGHRHDQTVLSILAHRYGATNFVERPRFTAYKGHETDETVLVNWGGM